MFQGYFGKVNLMEGTMRTRLQNHRKRPNLFINYPLRHLQGFEACVYCSILVINCELPVQEVSNSWRDAEPK